MSAVLTEALRQRADYTYKFNTRAGRHGWLRLTPAYSVKITEELMDQYEKPLRVLDPFCGTATTALSAAYHGHESVTMDINPFLVWFGKVKTAHYSRHSIVSTRDACDRIEKVVKRGAIEPIKAPPVHNIERWWSSDDLTFLCTLKASIEAESATGSPDRNLLLVAFCRILIELSNAAFNHQSMSFKAASQLRIPFVKDDTMQVFRNHVEFVLGGGGEKS